jgi:hypothetical protein
MSDQLLDDDRQNINNALALSIFCIRECISCGADQLLVIVTANAETLASRVFNVLCSEIG